MRRIMVGAAIALGTAALVVGPVSAQTTTTGVGVTTTTLDAGTTPTTSALTAPTDTTTSLPATGAPLLLGAGAGMGALALGQAVRRRLAR